MRVEVLWWEGCPSTPKAVEQLRSAMAELELDPGSITMREMTSDAEAEQEKFVGSPTIRVDGVDLFPSGDAPVGLSCRVYQLPDGRVSPTPDPELLRQALRRSIHA
jgi:hypothetical protein